VLRLRHATNFHTPWDSGSAVHHAAPTAPLYRFADALRTWRDALREAVGAHRRYEHLKSRGVAHDTALRQALGIPAVNSETRR
jgi:hypothetical protein